MEKDWDAQSVMDMFDLINHQIKSQNKTKGELNCTHCRGTITYTTRVDPDTGQTLLKTKCSNKECKMWIHTHEITISGMFKL